jgi:hypothetical protein
MIFMGDGDASKEHVKAWYMLSKLSTIRDAKDGSVHGCSNDQVLQQRLLELFAESNSLNNLEKAEREMKDIRVLSHTSTSVRERASRIIAMRGEYNDLNHKITKHIDCAGKDEAALAAIMKELVEMDKKIRIIGRCLSRAAKSEDTHRAAMDLTSIENEVRDEKILMEGRKAKLPLSTTKLRHARLTLYEYKRSFQARDHRFEDLSRHREEFDEVQLLLEERKELTNVSWVRTLIKEKFTAIEEIGNLVQQQDPQVEQIQAELDEIKQKMEDSIEEVLKRGVALHGLTTKSDNLRDQSRGFYTTVRTVISTSRPGSADST